MEGRDGKEWEGWDGGVGRGGRGGRGGKGWEGREGWEGMGGVGRGGRGRFDMRLTSYQGAPGCHGYPLPWVHLVEKTAKVTFWHVLEHHQQLNMGGGAEMRMWAGWEELGRDNSLQ